MSVSNNTIFYKRSRLDLSRPCAIGNFFFSQNDFIRRHPKPNQYCSTTTGHRTQQRPIPITFWWQKHFSRRSTTPTRRIKPQINSALSTRGRTAPGSFSAFVSGLGRHALNLSVGWKFGVVSRTNWGYGSLFSLGCR